MMLPISSWTGAPLISSVSRNSSKCSMGSSGLTVITPFCITSAARTALTSSSGAAPGSGSSDGASSALLTG